MKGTRRARERGQAAVESAIIMPLMVFMTLGLVQLTMVEHAKIMTEYAAYQAARAGIVWNGNTERMRDAASAALLPTMGRTDSLPELGSTFAEYKARDELLNVLPWGGPVPATFQGVNMRGQVRVDTVNPANYADLQTIWNLKEGPDWKELDLDGADSFAENPQLENHIGKFFDLSRPDAEADAYRKATVLAIRVRYLYELRIPFANWLIFLFWFASNADVALYGAIDRSTLANENMMNQDANVAALAGQGRGIRNEKGYDTLYPSEMLVLWGLSTGSITLAGGNDKRFFLPLQASYSMRMQSNFHRKWLMHESPSWNF
jgi:hypothetical protein